MGYRFALAGNPNSGKTTLFNHLTGSKAHVGNWPGVTVERKEGKYRKTDGEDINIIDLPGIYSLSPYTQEEVVARNYLAKEAPDFIINIVDATNIERNLYLSSQLMELDIPMVIALNMMDEVQGRGDTIDVEKLSAKIGIPVVPISAAKGQGIKELMDTAIQKAKNKGDQRKSILDNSELYPAIEKIGKEIENGGYSHSIYYAMKLLEQDELVKKELKLSADQEKTVKEIQAELGKPEEEYEILLADLRYKEIAKYVAHHVKRGRAAGELSRTDKIDRVMTHRVLAIPAFLLIMFLVFQISMGPISALIKDPLEALFGETLPGAVSGWLEAAGASGFVTGLVVDGVLAGVGAVISFLPNIVLLFLCLSFLEDTGYMARAAFIMDRLFRRFGLTGRSFIPLLMGFGCSVPAIMATRTLEDEKSRRLTVTMMPFMSCGAKLPVYAVFAGAFFSKNQGTIVFSLYILGIIVAILSGLLLKKTVFKGEAAPFVMELPAYRFPTFKTVMLHMWEKAKGYVARVGTLLLAMSVVIWLLQTYDFSFTMVENPQDSIFGLIGSAIAPIFSLNGFGYISGTSQVHWQIGAALLTGLIAKEAVVSTLSILYISVGLEELTPALGDALHSFFTPLAAYSLMVFVLLYAPCVAAMATARKELGSWKWTLFTILYQCGAAWLVSMVIYQAGKLLGIGLG